MSTSTAELERLKQILRASRDFWEFYSSLSERYQDRLTATRDYVLKAMAQYEDWAPLGEDEIAKRHAEMLERINSGRIL